MLERILRHLGFLPWAGQKTPGEGDIFDPDVYVEARYGKGFAAERQDRRDLPVPFDYFSQYDLSVYYRQRKSRWFSEENCSLSAVYAVLNYLKKAGIAPGLPCKGEHILWRAEWDRFYACFSAKGKWHISRRKQLPKLYSIVRQTAVECYGYRTGPTNPFRIPALLEKAGAKCGEAIKARHHLFWSFENQVIGELNKGTPVILNLAASRTYKSHSMVVTGCAVYRRERNDWGFCTGEQVRLLKVYDNWSACERWFDLSAYKGPASFVTVEVQNHSSF